MTRRYICLVTLLGLLPLLCSMGLSQDKAPVKSGDGSNEPLATIQAFWKACLDGNEEAVKKLITRTPLDLYKSTDQCRAKKRGEAYPPPPKTAEEAMKLFFTTRRGVSNIESDGNYSILMTTAEAISIEGYKEYKIVDQRQHENEALIRIQYGYIGRGEIKAFTYDDDFYLHKENDKWKIFANNNNNRSDLTPDVRNEYFAKECDAK